MKVRGTTKVPLHIAVCPDCGSQILMGIVEGLSEEDLESCVSLFGGVAVACCSRDDDGHLYDNLGWSETVQKLKDWSLRRSTR